MTEAKKLRSPTYFNGNPCKFGHIAPRRRTGNCEECLRLRRIAETDKRAARRRSYYERNKERENEYCRLYHLKNKDKRHAYGAEYRKKNVEHLRRHNELWRSKNPFYGREHREKHPSWYRSYAHTRRIRAGEDRLSPDISDKLFKMQNGKCAICFLDLGDDVHLDHITPLSKGGRNIDANIQLAHARCNIMKGSKDPIEFMRSLGFLL